MDHQPVWVEFHSTETCGTCDRCAYIKQRQEIGAVPGRQWRIWGSAVWLVLLLTGIFLFGDLPHASEPYKAHTSAHATR